MDSKQKIIVISREFGSGGHKIGEKIAKDLGISFYDRNLLDEIAKEKQVDVNNLTQYDEKAKRSFFHRKVRGYSSSPEDNLVEMQFDYIRKKAESGESFVIVGRCAEIILADNKQMISFFIRGEKEHKIERVMERYDLDRKGAKEKIKRHDKNRKNYHNHYAEHSWGHSECYDMCINSSTLGIAGSIEIIKQFILKYYGE